ncbi:MAG TPA: PAS domain S-box protein [Chryseolinea sp.]
MKGKKGDISFNCEELPMPVIVYRQDNGCVLKFNSEAKRVLGLSTSGKALNISKIRSEKLPNPPKSRSKKPLRFGPVIHRTNKGKEILLSVLRKSITFQGVHCFVDFLEGANASILSKDEKASINLSETLVFGKMGSAELDLQTFQLTVSKELFQLLDVVVLEPQTLPIEQFLKTYISADFLTMIQQKIEEGMSHGANKKVVNAEFEMLTGEGRKIWIEAIGIFKGDTALAILHEVTEPRKTQEALAETNELFKRLADNVPGMIFKYQLLDENTGQFLFASNGCEPLFGISAEKIRAQGLWHIIHPDDVALIRQTMKRGFHDRRPWDIEFRVIVPTGSVKWIAGVSNSYKSKNGEYCWFGFMHDITVRKVAELKTSESELKNRLIIENSGEGILFANTEGEIFSANPEACRIFGMTEKEICEGGRNALLDLSDPRLPAIFEERNKKSFYQGEVRLKRKDGAVFTGEITSKVFSNLKGDLNITLLVRDISERKMAEEELGRSASRFKLLYNQTPVMMHSIEVDGKLSRVSDYWLQKMEYSREEVLGKRSVEFMTAESRERAVKNLLDFIKSGIAINLEYDFVTKSGKVLNTLLSSSAEYDEQGKVVRSLAVVTDITETKKLAKRLELANKAARLGVWQIDFVKNSWECDDRLREIFGMEENVLTREKYWTIIHPDEIEAKRTRDKGLLQSSSSQYYDEYRIIRPIDQEVRYIKSQGLFFRDEQGNPLSGISVVYDQTQEKLTEQRILQSLKEKETLIKEVHHRIKNNLQLISSIVYLKLATFKQNDIREFLEGLRQKIKSIAGLHERLLQTEELDSVSIDDFLNKVLKDIQVSFYRPDLIVEAKTEILPTQLPSDVATYCGLIVNELVTNAIKHAFPSKSKGEVVVRFLQEAKGKFLLSVCDNGIGLPEHVAPQETGSFGMSLLYIFMKQLGGEFSILRKNGTDFQIRFSA